MNCRLLIVPFYETTFVSRLSSSVLFEIFLHWASRWSRHFSFSLITAPRILNSCIFMSFRYHKQHPFSSEVKVIDIPVKTDLITFESPFGKFGTFTCFDVLYQDPAISLVEKYDIDHVVYPTAWFDVLPLLTAIGFHSSWARGTGVNFLASNSHVPSLQNAGSGIYSYNGAKAFYRSFSENGFLLIATLPVSRQKRVNVGEMLNVLTSSTETIVSDDFYSFLHNDLFLFKELVKVKDTLNICYNNSATCCSLTYEMTSKRSDEMYALGVYDGIHAGSNPRYFRTCTLVKCLSLERKSCGKRVNNAKTIFKSILLKSQLNAKYVFPQVVADGVSLLPGEWTHGHPANYMQTTQQLTKGLVMAALFARVYDLDLSTTTGSTTISPTNLSATGTRKIFTNSHVSSILTIVCLCLKILHRCIRKTKSRACRNEQ